jgi:hypothetical protein
VFRHFLDLRCLQRIVVVETDNAIVGDRNAEHVAGEIAEHGLSDLLRPRRCNCTIRGFLHAAFRTARSGLRFASAALSLPHTSLANPAGAARSQHRALASCPAKIATCSSLPATGRVLAFDDLSGLPVWISDSLCRLATGGGFAVRQL